MTTNALKPVASTPTPAKPGPVKKPVKHHFHSHTHTLFALPKLLAADGKTEVKFSDIKAAPSGTVFFVQSVGDANSRRQFKKP